MLKAFKYEKATGLLKQGIRNKVNENVMERSLFLGLFINYIPIIKLNKLSLSKGCLLFVHDV